MYDRASRDLSRPLNTTIDTVGPGSYELPVFLHGRNKGSGKMPFEHHLCIDEYILCSTQ
jgi:hypothetical protein